MHDRRDTIELVLFHVIFQLDLSSQHVNYSAKFYSQPKDSLVDSYVTHDSPPSLYPTSLFVGIF